MARRRSGSQRDFNRTDRIGGLVRDVLALELERIDDERLELVSITTVQVDGALEHAKVYYSSLHAEEEGRLDEVAEALAELRWPLQQVVNREVRARKTPQISFHYDDVLTSALRIDDILKDMAERGEFDEDPDDQVQGDQESSSEASSEEDDDA